MVTNTTIIKQASIRTRISEGLELMTICACLSHPEKKFIKIAAAITTPRGRPTDNCFRTFLFLRRWYCQYSINFSSSSVIMSLQRYEVLYKKSGKSAQSYEQV